MDDREDREDRRRVEDDLRFAEALQQQFDRQEAVDSRARISASAIVGTRPDLTSPSYSSSPTRDVRVRHGEVAAEHSPSDSESELSSALPSSASTVRATASATVVATSSAEPSQRRLATVSVSAFTGTRAATALRTTQLPLRVRSLQLSQIPVRPVTDWLPPSYGIYRVIATTLGRVTVFECIAGGEPRVVKEASVIQGEKRSPDNILNEIAVLNAMGEERERRGHSEFWRFFAKILYCGKLDKVPAVVWFSMPFFPNDLSEYIVNEMKRKKYAGRRLASAEHRGICRHLFEGLNYLHRRGITHNDICCDNVAVLIGSDGKAQAKFIDLGAATFNIAVGISRENPSTRIPTEVTEGSRRNAPGDASKRVWPHRSNFGVGHIATMSPECYCCYMGLKRTWYDLYSADIWSLAVVCLETLSGQFVKRFDYVPVVANQCVRDNPNLLDPNTRRFFAQVFQNELKRMRVEGWIRTNATFGIFETTTEQMTDASITDSSPTLASASATDPRAVRGYGAVVAVPRTSAVARESTERVSAGRRRGAMAAAEPRGEDGVGADASGSRLRRRSVDLADYSQ